MNEKKTKELVDILGKTHISEFDKYCREQKDSILPEEQAFGKYIKGLLKERKLTQQIVFLKADIPDKRDIILRICYAAELTLEETQRALEKYKMPQLYAKIPRDALLMLIFQERPGGIIEVNELLMEKGMNMLQTSGVQE